LPGKQGQTKLNYAVRVAKIINLVTVHRNAYYASKKLPNIATQRELQKKLCSVKQIK